MTFAGRRHGAPSTVILSEAKDLEGCEPRIASLLLTMTARVLLASRPARCSSAAAGAAPSRSPPTQALAIAAGDNDSRIAALNAAVARGDERLAAFVQALLDDEVKVAGDKVFIVHDGKATDAATGAAATLPEGAEDVTNNNRTRGALEAALAGLRVLSPDVARAPRRRRRARQGLARRIVSCRWSRRRSRPRPIRD